MVNNLVVGSNSGAQKLQARSIRNLGARLLSGKLLFGILLAAVIAGISFLIGDRLGGPVMLYALVIGLLCHPLSSNPYLTSGLNFSANHILKIGVALLAVKITVIDVADLGFQTAGLVVGGLISTMVIGAYIGKLFGLSKDMSLLTAGSVAICGCSAALAIASVLPQKKDTECNTIATIITVTTLSTIAMVVYPAIASILNLSDTVAGIFVGATIHNVAQVVGAGYIISDSAGEIATIVKLMRVACLLPIIIIVSLMFRNAEESPSSTKKPPLLPMFMIGFILIMLINSAGFIPASIAFALSEFSKWALVMAVAALGVQTSLKDIARVGMKPILVQTLQTAFLACFALVGLGLVLTL